MTQWANLWNHTDCLLDQTASFKLMFACSLLRNRQQNWVSVNFTVTVFSSESNFTFEKKNAKVVSPSVTSSPIITFQHHFFAFLTFPHYLLLCSHVAHKKPFRHVLTPSPSTSCAHLPILSALLSAWSASVRIKSEGHFWSWEGTKDAISVHTKLKIQNFSSFSFNRGSIDSSSLQIVVKARNVFMFLKWLSFQEHLRHSNPNKQQNMWQHRNKGLFFSLYPSFSSLCSVNMSTTSK